jgi:hypothetical protein
LCGLFVHQLPPRASSDQTRSYAVIEWSDKVAL